MRIGAITNVYNESFNLPIWLRYYGAQCGLENCLVVDDGSDDGSTGELGGANHLRTPRSTFDDRARADVISSLVGSMLSMYDWVVYSDCDELLVADPRRFGSLRELCESVDVAAVTACGLNVIHRLDDEAPLRAGEAILGAQRSHVQFVSPMCKTLLVRERPSRGGGFHSSNFSPYFNGLYLFHLRNVDLGESLRRLATTRDIINSDGAGEHHRAAFTEHVKRFQWFAQMPVNPDFRFDDNLAQFEARIEFSHTSRYYAQEPFNAKEARTVPDEFSGLF